MSRRRLQPIVDAVVTPLLAVGFEKRRQSTTFIQRSVDDSVVSATGPAYTQRLGEHILGVFIAEGGGTRLAPVYGVRHEGIMLLLDEAGIDLDEDVNRPHLKHALFKPTLTCYDYLKDRQPGQPSPNVKRAWLFQSQEDVDRYVPRVQACIERTVLPYMRRCRSLEGIVDEMLKQSDSRSYFPIAAGLHLLGRNEEVIDFFERWLTKYSQIEYNDAQESVNRERRYSSWLIDRMQAGGWDIPQRRLKALEPLLRERLVLETRI